MKTMKTMKMRKMRKAGMTMARMRVCGVRRWSIALLAVGMGAAMMLAASATARAEDGFVKPTAEELAMTSLPGYPGAAAVVLFREEITKDDLHVVEHYERIKILTEDGKKYANVQLNYVRTGDSAFEFGDDKKLGDIVGRTIHSDGTIVPFTGKPYKKVMEKMEAAKFEAMVFTLPDVEVGSIIEYRYATRINDNMFEAPDWYIQGDLYVKSAHYVWFPTTKQLVDSKERLINSISWFPILPPGVQIDHKMIAQTSSYMPTGQSYEVVVKDVPPIVKEEYMPPISSYSYRVLFNFTSYHSGDDFWKSEGHDWSKRSNSFADPNSDLKAATEAVLAGATTQDQKLRKIYATVMAMENSRFTREHEQKEDKAEGEGKIKTAADVLARKRGTATQLTDLFVGMARAAGMKAYLMLVPDRSEQLFVQGWLSFQQFDEVVAIVNVDGKEVFFDPGSRYCAYGHLAWEHTFVRGLRQTEGGTEFALTTGDDFKVNRTTRVANLKMDEQDEVTGTIDLTFEGSAALGWRQAALRGDDESLKHGLRTHLEGEVPKSLEVKVAEIANLDDYEQPLKVTYDVKGTLGTATGKRLVLPSDLFEAGTAAIFPHEKRQNAVYFRYPQLTQDALRIHVPADFTVEAVPSEAKFEMPGRALYSIRVSSTPESFTTRRDYGQGGVIYLPTDYAALRTFYSQLESKDQESVVLKPAVVTTAATAGAANR
jgi:hypothetical protein